MVDSVGSLIMPRWMKQIGPDIGQEDSPQEFAQSKDSPDVAHEHRLVPELCALQNSTPFAI
jgi:hypothetical protein